MRVLSVLLAVTGVISGGPAFGNVIPASSTVHAAAVDSKGFIYLAGPSGCTFND